MYGANNWRKSLKSEYLNNGPKCLKDTTGLTALIHGSVIKTEFIEKALMNLNRVTESKL